MKKYDHWSIYPYTKYGNAVVLKHHLEHQWMNDNLVATQPKFMENDATGSKQFIGLIVGYQCWKVEDGSMIYSFYAPENRQRVIELLPELVVERDPFGPDVCPKCGGQISEKVISPSPLRSWWQALKGLMK